MAPLPPESQSNRLLPGLLVVPFVVGAGLVLLGVAGVGAEITETWLLVAVVIGILASAVTLAVALHRPHPHAAALGGSGGAALPATDPLARVHLVEATGRQHRKPCANCGTPVKVDDDKCGNCGHAQMFECKGCRAKVRLSWDHCPECGRNLH